MRHYNSLFSQLAKLVGWRTFQKLVDDRKADHGVRRLTTKGQFPAMLFGQLAGATSVREIENGLTSHDNLL